MSKEYPTMMGTLSGVPIDRSFGFVNDAKPCNGHTGEIPSCVFVRASEVKGVELHEGMRIAFDTRPSTHPKHAGKSEAFNIIQLHDYRLPDQAEFGIHHWDAPGVQGDPLGVCGTDR